MTRTADIWHSGKKAMNRHLFRAMLIPALLAVLLCLLCFLLFSGWIRALLCTAVTAAAACTLLHTLYAKLLPRLRTDRLLRSLQDVAEETVEGIYLGEKPACTLQDGVRMHVLRMDTGEQHRGEPIERELHLPATLGHTLRIGQSARFSVCRGIPVGMEADAGLWIQLRGGALAVPRIQYFLAVLLSALLWLGGYELGQRLFSQKPVNLAVCTLAYHAESEAILSEAAKAEGLSLSFAYSTTLDRETLYQYLATYGTFEADLLLLPLSDYLSAFDCETPAFPAVPESVRWVANTDGEPVAILLYDPDDPVCSAAFRAMTDWIAVPKDEPYVLALGPSAKQSSLPAASLLLSVFLQGDFRKE